MNPEPCITWPGFLCSRLLLFITPTCFAGNPVHPNQDPEWCAFQIISKITGGEIIYFGWAILIAGLVGLIFFIVSGIRDDNKQHFSAIEKEDKHEPFRVEIPMGGMDEKLYNSDTSTEINSLRKHSGTQHIDKKTGIRETGSVSVQNSQAPVKISSRVARSYQQTNGGSANTEPNSKQSAKKPENIQNSMTIKDLILQKSANGADEHDIASVLGISRDEVSMVLNMGKSSQERLND